MDVKVIVLTFKNLN